MPRWGTVNLSNPKAIFAGSPPRFTRSRVTYEACAVSRTSTRPQVDSASTAACGPDSVHIMAHERGPRFWSRSLPKVLFKPAHAMVHRAPRANPYALGGDGNGVSTY